MSIALYRTHSTSLSEDELLILDVMFDSHVTLPMLRQHRFTMQFNAPSHSLDDERLRVTIRRLTADEVLAPIEVPCRGHQYLAMTPIGGDLWSRERCPVWDRYCYDRYPAGAPGHEVMSVRAVTADVRDDFLRLMSPPFARLRTRVINDGGLIHWHPFGRVHVGLASYAARSTWTTQQRSESWEGWDVAKRDRTWWRTVRELQRFVVPTLE